MKYKLLLLFIFLISAFPVSAESFSLSLNPEKHEVVSKPGQTITLPYSLTNLGDPQVISFKIYTLQINNGMYELSGYENTENNPQFAVINSAFELEKPFLMNAKSTVLFDLEMSIPENAISKDYYVSLVAESTGQKGNEGASSIQIQGGIGSHIILTVTDSGQLEKSAQISEFTIPTVPQLTIGGKKYFIIDRNNPVPFNLTVANKGNNYIYTTGSIRTASNTPLNLPKTTILANSTSTISSPAKHDELLFSKKFMGIDTVMATINVGNSQIIYQNATLLIIPIKLIISLGIFLFISFFIYFFIINKKKRRT